MYDDDVSGEPSREGEPVESDHGVLIENHKHEDRPDDEGRDIDLGEGRDPELWGKQAALIEEDEGDGLKLEGFKEDQIPRIMAAMGDDAAEAISDFPGGVSATGSVSEPDHGGFPDRD
jgi:hypothetical protein